MSHDLIAKLSDREIQSLQNSYIKIIDEAIKNNPMIKKMIYNDLCNFLQPLMIQQMAIDLEVEEWDIETLFAIKILKDSETNNISLSIKRNLN